MKITYLKICNYKSIEQLEITDIENALILVGKNNTSNRCHFTGNGDA